MINGQNSVGTTGNLTNSPQQVGDEAESYFSGCCFHRWIVAMRLTQPFMTRQFLANW